MMNEESIDEDLRSLGNHVISHLEVANHLSFDQRNRSEDTHGLANESESYCCLWILVSFHFFFLNILNIFFEYFHFWIFRFLLKLTNSQQLTIRCYIREYWRVGQMRVIHSLSESDTAEYERRDWRSKCWPLSEFECLQIVMGAIPVRVSEDFHCLR